MNVSQGTIAIVISTIALFGSGTGAYVDLRADQREVASVVAEHTIELRKLDNYDLLLQESVNMNRESVVRMETLYTTSEKTTARLSANIDGLQTDIKNLTKAIYKLDKS